MVWLRKSDQREAHIEQRNKNQKQVTTITMAFFGWRCLCSVDVDQSAEQISRIQTTGREIPRRFIVTKNIGTS